MIVSVHMPKTAGRSFEAALRRRFGAAILEDYGTYPLNTPPGVRQRAAIEACLAHASQAFDGIDCIHGHFLPIRYLLLASARPVTFVTWLRHPVQRVLSHYHYWHRAYDPATAPPLHRRVVEEQWSLERFCLSDEMRNVYAQFLWGFPIDNFDFVGITEHYDDDLAYFARRYLEIEIPSERVNAVLAPGEGHQVDPDLERRIAACHARDMALYERALEARQARPVS
ncbi:MAG: hypothetical protein R2745_19915 [Vicinamibacterales bacterium]